MASTGFVSHVLDMLADWGGVTSKSMFGGHGVYRKDVLFAMVVDDVLYLKADDVNRPDFEARGLKPFTYHGKSKPVSMSYWEVPSECVDDASALRTWSEGALAASLRKGGPKPAKKKAKPVAALKKKLATKKAAPKNARRRR